MDSKVVCNSKGKRKPVEEAHGRDEILGNFLDLGDGYTFCT